MAEPTIPDFLGSLGNSRLLTDAQFELLQKQLAETRLTATGLAQVLVRQQHLTEWQARQLLKGQSGFVLNHYQLLNPVGRGGMGHVFRGLDLKTNHVVAVKVMAKKLTTNQTLVSRFRREIRASSQLDSPYIVKTLDAGRVGTVDFMVMEYVNGDQVDRIATRLGRVPVGIACEIIRQIAAGLQHAHEHQMVHRDIKPGNMMVHWEESGAGVSKLMDMGLVLVLSDDSHDHTVTRAGQVMGTPDYMSPEQGWDTTKVDIRSDIYSLGCALFRLLTGKIPFTGSNPLQVLSQRLQRDAPSVLSVCDDIPEQVAAVVSKMTRRDPDDRYQTPAEVAAALAEVSEPLTKKSLQLAVRTATDDPDAAISDPQSDEVDEMDVTYQHFLTEVEKGSAVDLMLTTDVNIGAHAVTVPVPDIKIAAAPAAGDKSRPRPRREQKTGLLVLGGSVVVIGIVAAMIPLLTGNDDAPERPVVENPQPAPPASVAVGRFLPPQPETAQTGETWTFTPQTETEAATGSLTFELGDTAPAGISVDPSTGRLTWNLIPDQAAGTYTIPLRLSHVLNDRVSTLDELELQVHVEYGRAAVRLPTQRPRELDVEKTFATSMAVNPVTASAFRLSYRVLGASPSGFHIDPTSGNAEWTPGVTDMGRHVVSIGVFEQQMAEPLDQQDLIMLVLPTMVRHVLPDLPQQTAEAGKTFRYLFPAAELPRPPRLQGLRRIEVAAGAPAGISISPDSRELTWEVPGDLSGVVRVPLRARLQMQRSGTSRELDGSAVLEVNIKAAAAAPAPAPASTLPSAEEIAPALTEIRDTYRQRLAFARTLPQKATLASQLLESVYEADAGVTDAALLQLIEDELADKSRAVDVLFEIAKIRAGRYGTDELAAAAEIVELFRRTSLEAVQQDSVVEHGLRLARQATRAKNFGLADGLLQMVSTLLRGSPAQGVAAQLSADISSAAKLAAELAKAPNGTAGAIKAEEVGRLLDRWQFEPLFSSGTGLSHFGVTATGTGAVNGRALWKFADGRIRLAGATQQAAVGFYEPAAVRSRFVIRMEVGGATTSAQLIIGARGSGQTDFSAFGVILDSTGPGKVLDIRNRSAVAEPSAVVRLFSDQANRFEVVVDGTTVAVRINGLPATQAQIAELTEGRIGLAANLGTPEPRLLIRGLRILSLPDRP